MLAKLLSDWTAQSSPKNPSASPQLQGLAEKRILWPLSNWCPAGTEVLKQPVSQPLAARVEKRRTSCTKGSGWHCNKSTESKTRSGASYLAQIGGTAQGQIVWWAKWWTAERHMVYLKQEWLLSILVSIVNVTMSISSLQWILTNKDMSIKWLVSSFQVRLFELLDMLDWIQL